MEENKRSEIKAYEDERNSLQEKLKKEIEERKRELKRWYDEKVLNDGAIKFFEKDNSNLKEENYKLKDKLNKKIKIIELNKFDNMYKIYKPDKNYKNKHKSFSPHKYNYKDEKLIG